MAKAELLTGKVYLVGAGPGDPELLTLRAARVLGDVDAVLLDEATDRRCLIYTRPDARIVRVTRQPGALLAPEAFMLRLMISLACCGSSVAHVAGGDPRAMTRLAEVLAGLRDAGIEVELVPGVAAESVVRTRAAGPDLARAELENALRR